MCVQAAGSLVYEIFSNLNTAVTSCLGRKGRKGKREEGREGVDREVHRRRQTRAGEGARWEVLRLADCLQCLEMKGRRDSLSEGHRRISSVSVTFNKQTNPPLSSHNLEYDLLHQTSATSRGCLALNGGRKGTAGGREHETAWPGDMHRRAGDAVL